MEDTIYEPLPVKRTVKKNKIFPVNNAYAVGRFLCGETQFVLFHWRQHTQVALHDSVLLIRQKSSRPFRFIPCAPSIDCRCPNSCIPSSLN